MLRKSSGDRVLSMTRLLGFVLILQQPANSPGDHQLLVGANHADGGRTLVRRNYRSAHGVSTFIQFDAEKSQAAADTRAHVGRILTDASGKYQRVHPTQ